MSCIEPIVMEVYVEGNRGTRLISFSIWKLRVSLDWFSSPIFKTKEVSERSSDKEEG